MASTILSDNGVSSGSAGIKTSADSTGVLALQTTTAGGAVTTAVTIDTSQNVGIGTASPSSLGKFVVLTAQADTTDMAVFQRTGTGTFRIRAPSSALATIGTQFADSLAFETNATERMRLNTTGALVLAGGSTSANGIGISFPATQSASTDANTLDDYEEGTWTPADGSGAGLSLTNNSATYTKIGNTVRLTFYGNYPATANTNQASISGLPFTVNNYGSACILSSNSTQSALVRGISSLTKVDIKQLVSDTSVTNVQLSSAFIIFTLIYNV